MYDRGGHINIAVAAAASLTCAGMETSGATVEAAAHRTVGVI